eukprot:361957-Chlamydomonas_euryale.AAC.2
MPAEGIYTCCCPSMFFYQAELGLWVSRVACFYALSNSRVTGELIKPDRFREREALQAQSPLACLNRAESHTIGSNMHDSTTGQLARGYAHTSTLAARPPCSTRRASSASPRLAMPPTYALHRSQSDPFSVGRTA